MPKEYWNPSPSDRIEQSKKDRERMRLGADLARSPYDIEAERFYNLMPASMFSDYNTYGTLYRDGTNTGNNTEEKKNKVAVKVLDKIKAAAQEFKGDEEKGDALMTKAQEYRDLGLIKIAEELEKKGMKAWKEFQISMAGYKRMNRSEIREYEQELERVSDMSSKRRLIETPLGEYIGQHQAKEAPTISGSLTFSMVVFGTSVTEEKQKTTEEQMGVPPADVLEKLKIAKDSKLFDAFSVLHIKYVPDPILCGKINESDDLYFIAEWGDDVKFIDIVK